MYKVTVLEAICLLGCIVSTVWYAVHFDNCCHLLFCLKLSDSAIISLRRWSPDCCAM